MESEFWVDKTRTREAIRLALNAGVMGVILPHPAIETLKFIVHKRQWPFVSEYPLTGHNALDSDVCGFDLSIRNKPFEFDVWEADG